MDEQLDLVLADYVCFVKVDVLKQLAGLLSGHLVKTENIKAMLAKPLFASKVEALYFLFGLDQVFGEAVVVDHTGAVDLAQMLLYFEYVVMSGLWALDCWLVAIPNLLKLLKQIGFKFVI
jgi:hypothetical protein